MPHNPAVYYLDNTLLKSNTSFPAYYNSNSSSNPNPAEFVPYDVMNFLRQYGIPYHLDQAEANTGKDIVDFKMRGDFFTSSTNRGLFFDYLYTGDKVTVVPDLYPL